MGIEKYNLDSEVYQNLTESLNSKDSSFKKKWTSYLIVCSLIACFSSVQFGYNIGAVNSVTPLVMDYFEHGYFQEAYYDKLDQFKAGEEKLANGTARYNAGLKTFNEKKLYLETKEKELIEAENRRDNYLDIMFSFDEKKIAEAKAFKAKKEKEIKEKYNTTVEIFMEKARQKIDEGKIKLANARVQLSEAKIKIENGTKMLEFYRVKLSEGRAKLDIVSDMICAFFNVLFIIGGMVGAFTSKHVLDRFGYRKGIMFHQIFSLIGALLTFVPSYFMSQKLASLFIKLGRFFFGVQGGMSCSLIPMYLYEIAPFSLRKKLTIFHSIAVAFGILISQVLGYQEILGNESYWKFLLSASLVPCIVGFLLLFLIADSPGELIDNRDENNAQKVLKKLRNTKNVNGEIQLLNKELGETAGEKVRFADVLNDLNIRWPVVCGILLQICQQFSGINIVFFYSRSLFETAGVPDEYLQYAVSLTGLINLLSLSVFLPLINKLSRKKLLISTMLLIVVDLTCIVTFMKLQKEHCSFPFVTVACILIFVVLFSAGLGPLPFLFIEECFGDNKDARSSPTFVCIVSNWIAALIVTLDFPFLIKYMQGYTFIISIIVVLFTVFFIAKKVPETKDRTPAQIQADFK